MYLHEDKEMFKEAIEQVAEDSGRAAGVIEKDYYVTMILHLLSQELSNVYLRVELLYQRALSVICYLVLHGIEMCVL